MPATSSATASTSPSHLMPIIAWRGKPSVSGSVTATICMTPSSSSRCTRWRTAASERPTALPMAEYGFRPSFCSCSMIRLEMSSSGTGPPLLDRAFAGVVILGGCPLWGVLGWELIGLDCGGRVFDIVSARLSLSSDFVAIWYLGHEFPCLGRFLLSESRHLQLHLNRRSTVTTRLQNFINGKFVDAASGRFSDVIDPTTGEVYAQAPVSGKEDVDAAYAAAAAAFETWGQTTPAERSALLLKIADAI